MPPALASINDTALMVTFLFSMAAMVLGTAQGDPGKIIGRDRPTLLVFYVDDSRDCKQYAPVVSRLQAFYGRVADFVIINVDNIPPKVTYTPNEPGYYYEGVVPQVLVFNKSGGCAEPERSGAV